MSSSFGSNLTQSKLFLLHFVRDCDLCLILNVFQYCQTTKKLGQTNKKLQKWTATLHFFNLLDIRNINITKKCKKAILLHIALISPDKSGFCRIFGCFKIKKKVLKKIFSRLLPLRYLNNCPRKYLKIFSTDFIFRQQKILLKTRIVGLNSNNIMVCQLQRATVESEVWFKIVFALNIKHPIFVRFRCKQFFADVSYLVWISFQDCNSIHYIY